MILRGPVITEKTLTLAGRGQFTFLVDSRANAPEVARAVSDQFKVTVTSVHMIRIPGAERFFRLHRGRTAGFKKAVVSLKPGQTIPGFSFESKTEKKGSKTAERQESKTESTKKTEKS